MYYNAKKKQRAAKDSDLPQSYSTKDFIWLEEHYWEDVDFFRFMDVAAEWNSHSFLKHFFTFPKRWVLHSVRQKEFPLGYASIEVSAHNYIKALHIVFVHMEGSREQEFSFIDACSFLATASFLAYKADVISLCFPNAFTDAKTRLSGVVIKKALSPFFLPLLPIDFFYEDLHFFESSRQEWFEYPLGKECLTQLAYLKKRLN